MTRKICRKIVWHSLRKRLILFSPSYCDNKASYTAEDVGKFKTIVAFDCRGVEPVEFSPRTGWIVKAADNGQQFEDVDLSDDDWVEYDTKNNVSIGIYEIESNFIKMKK